jgi:SPP1 family predicted phage head-tail adaptor
MSGLRAGSLTSRVRFERRATVDDGYGNTQGSYAPVLTVWASFRPQFGSEQLRAGRLESTIQGKLVVRRSEASEAITAADRLAFIAGPFTGKTCQIRSIIPTMDNRSIEMTLEETST